MMSCLMEQGEQPVSMVSGKEVFHNFGIQEARDRNGDLLAVKYLLHL